MLALSVYLYLHTKQDIVKDANKKIRKLWNMMGEDFQFERKTQLWSLPWPGTSESEGQETEVPSLVCREINFKGIVKERTFWVKEIKYVAGQNGIVNTCYLENF